MELEGGLHSGFEKALRGLPPWSPGPRFPPLLRPLPLASTRGAQPRGRLRLENRLSLRHLKTIDAIDRYGSLSQAAIALGKTQPALSKALAEAEQVLGIELF